MFKLYYHQKTPFVKIPGVISSHGLLSSSNEECLGSMSCCIMKLSPISCCPWEWYAFLVWSRFLRMPCTLWRCFGGDLGMLWHPSHFHLHASLMVLGIYHLSMSSVPQLYTVILCFKLGQSTRLVANHKFHCILAHCNLFFQFANLSKVFYWQLCLLVSLMFIQCNRRSDASIFLWRILVSKWILIGSSCSSSLETRVYIF